MLTLSVSDDNDTDEPLIVNVFDNTASSYRGDDVHRRCRRHVLDVMPNVMLDAPTGTTMSGERPTAGLLVVSFTVAPAVDGAGVAGMGPLKVTVPVTLAPPVTLGRAQCQAGHPHTRRLQAEDRAGGHAGGGDDRIQGERYRRGVDREAPVVAPAGQ